MRSAPIEQAYHDNQPSLLPDVRDMLALHRERGVSTEELAARLHQQDEHAIRAALEALELDDGIAA